MKITTTGFYGTGSSAITDLLKEYSTVACKDDYELRFLFDPDGISDLEYNLIENPNRHNSSHSLKRFIRNMERLDHIWFVNRYNKYFDGTFLSHVNTFIESIVELEYSASWHYDVYDRGNAYYILTRSYSKIRALAHKILHTKMDGRSLQSNKDRAYLTTMNEEVFLEATRNLVDNLVTKLNPENKPYVMLDQLVPPSNIERYKRYVNNLKVIVVDRDPRDIFLLEKEVWRGTVAPTNSVEEFCKWYRWTRNTAKKGIDGDTLFIQFEDLIYQYQTTVKTIEVFLDLKACDHVGIKSSFNPQKSINNTQLWNVYTQYSNEMQYIYEHLTEYCYDFPLDVKSDRVNVKELF